MFKKVPFSRKFQLSAFLTGKKRLNLMKYLRTQELKTTSFTKQQTAIVNEIYNRNKYPQDYQIAMLAKQFDCKYEVVDMKFEEKRRQDRTNPSRVCDSNLVFSVPENCVSFRISHSRLISM